MPHSRTKPAEHERRHRRAALDVLLARAQRGRLSQAEAALLAEYVRAELANADATRRALAGTTRALDRARKGADETIRALETEAAQLRTDAEQAEQHRKALADALGCLHHLTWQQLIEQAAEEARCAHRFAGYLTAAQAACGAPRWPVLAETVRRLRRQAEGAERARQYLASVHPGTLANSVRDTLLPLLTVDEQPTDPDAPIPYQLTEPATASSCTCPPAQRVADRGHRTECPDSLGTDPTPADQ